MFYYEPLDCHLEGRYPGWKTKLTLVSCPQTREVAFIWLPCDENGRPLPIRSETLTTKFGVKRGQCFSFQ